MDWMAISGFILGALLSWTVNRSVVWSIIHGIFGWLYVIYYALVIWEWDKML
jgi:hypothetical protein